MFHVDFPAAVIQVLRYVFLMRFLPSIQGHFISRWVPGQTSKIFETLLSYFGRSGLCNGGNVGVSLLVGWQNND
jgi:predicted Na+-dependent transporter